MEDYSGAHDAGAITSGIGIFLVIGWACALLSLFTYPFILGIIGVICGILSTKSGSRAGLALIVTSIILMGIGMIFSPALMNYARLYLGA